MKSFSDRVLVSFTGTCPLECKHCYTLDQSEPKNNNDIDEIEQIVESISGSSFDIIYVSHDRENFIDEHSGLRLVESLYDTYRRYGETDHRYDAVGQCHGGGAGSQGRDTYLVRRRLVMELSPLCEKPSHPLDCTDADPLWKP